MNKIKSIIDASKRAIKQFGSSSVSLGVQFVCLVGILKVSYDEHNASHSYPFKIEKYDDRVIIDCVLMTIMSLTSFIQIFCIITDHGSQIKQYFAQKHKIHPSIDHQGENEGFRQKNCTQNSYSTFTDIDKTINTNLPMQVNSKIISPHHIMKEITLMSVDSNATQENEKIHHS